ncbi:MAG: hypothetical protein LBG49_01510 [Mycoplasmataceae bacterium]|jgi:hypothetical protein|nr:hypothetical protein [Mycoplasmataceae bacterium]
MARQYKITKATYEKLVGVIFEYAIINDVKAPKWFSEFVEKQFKPFVTKTESDIANIKTRLEKVESEIVGIKTDIVTINDILKRNNLR